MAGPNYTVIPNDWANLEYIISDLCSRIIDEDSSFTDYLLADGSRTLTGDWSLGGFNLTSAGNITGTDIDISAGTGTYTSSGTITAGSLTASNLTETRVVFAGADGLLTDDEDFTFVTDTLTAAKVTVGTDLVSGILSLDLDTDLKFRFHIDSDSQALAFCQTDPDTNITIFRMYPPEASESTVLQLHSNSTANSRTNNIRLTILQEMGQAFVVTQKSGSGTATKLILGADSLSNLTLNVNGTSTFGGNVIIPNDAKLGSSTADVHTINNAYILPKNFGTTGHLVTAAGSDQELTYTDPATLSVALAAEVTVADESSDTTCFPAFFTAATGGLPIKTDADGLTYNAATKSLGIGGNLTVGTTVFLVDETNGAVAINTSPVSTAFFRAIGLTGSAGSVGQGLFSQSGAGGTASGSGVQVGGGGGSTQFLGGVGGNASSTDNTATGGSGGQFSFTGGQGGNAFSTGNVKTGGAGGGFILAGGEAGGGIDFGGTGGDLTIVGGEGGGGVTASGTGGDLFLDGGAGGVDFGSGVGDDGNIFLGGTTGNVRIGDSTAPILGVLEVKGVSFFGAPEQDYTQFSATGSITQAGSADATLTLTTSSTQTEWDSAYDNMVTAIAFNTGDGIITITQQDSGTLTTDSLDGRYIVDTTDVIKDTHIDWGLGANQVNAEDMPYTVDETVAHIFDETLNSGLMHDCTITDAGGLAITWPASEVWDATNSTEVDTDSGGGTCTDNITNYIVFTIGTGSTLQLRTTPPDDSLGEIGIAHVVCQAGDIWEIHQDDRLLTREYEMSGALGQMFPSIVTTGLIVNEDTDATNVWDVTISSGVYYINGHLRQTVTGYNTRTGGKNLVRWFHNAGVWTSDTNAEIDNTQWDDPTKIGGQGLEAVGVAKYYASSFFLVGEVLHWVYPNAEYNTIGQAMSGGGLDKPPGFLDDPDLMIVIIKGNDAAFPTAGGTRWIDIRPLTSATINAGIITDHGNLSGLTNDNHNIGANAYHTDGRAATWLAANHETTFTHADIATNTSHSGTVHDYAHISGNDGATDVSAAELEELTNTSETTLHSHAGGFVNRGDPASFDFDDSDLTVTGTWTDLDLSSIVGTGAKSVLVRVMGRDTLVSTTVQFRTNGNADAWNVGRLEVQVSGVLVVADLIIPLNSDRIIEYHQDIDWDLVQLTVKGWWL